MKPEQLGPYKILEPLGRGGMGTVYRAVDTTNGRPAAVKVLAPIVAQDSGFRERFEAEVASLEQLSHPHIVQLYGYGEQDGHLFYAMELVSGRSLQSELGAGRRYHWREALGVIVDLCGALKHAHDHGIIHRDIKPANLLIAEQHDASDEKAKVVDEEFDTSTITAEAVHVKLADFGIAKLFGNTSLTVDGGVLGTADYMSPEQAEGEPVTPRSDLYSLGCVLYAMLSGQPPFRGKSIPEVIHKVRFDKPKPISRLVDDVPRELEHILNQLLAKSPSDRVPTALALSNRLQSLQHGLTMKIDQALAEGEGAAAEPTPAAPPVGEFHDQDTMLAGAAPSHTSSAGTVPESQDHFVAVDELSEFKATPLDSEPVWWRALTILALLVPLVLIGWGAYFFIAPPSADNLFATVSGTAGKVENYYSGLDIKEGPPPDLTSHRAEVESFLRRFPKDPRAEQMNTWRQQILAAQLELKLERKMKMGWDSAQVSPLEDLVLKTMRLESQNPLAALIHYEDILRLFPANAKQAPDVELVMQSVRGRMEKLARRIRKTNDLHLALIGNRLAKAEAAQDSNPKLAIEILKSIVKVYRGHSWAKEPVALALNLLKQIEGATTEDDSTETAGRPETETDLTLGE